MLDNGSSASFVSERLAQTLRLPRTSQISGIAGITQHPSHQSVASFSVSPIKSPYKKFDVTAIVVPRVTCDLPFNPIPLKKEWNHLEGVDLVDPGFGCPGKIDVLLAWCRHLCGSHNMYLAWPAEWTYGNPYCL